MAISLSRLKSTKRSDPPIVVLYGVDGIGKTSLAAEFPNPIYLATEGERPPSDVEMATPEDENGEQKLIESWEDIESVFQELLTAEHDFKTVIIDSLDGLAPFVEGVTAARIGAASVDDNSKGSPAAFGNGYKESTVEWTHFMSGCEALSHAGIGVVLIAHNTIRNFKSPTTDPYDTYDIALNKLAAPVVRAKSDVVAFLNRRVSIKEKEVSRDKKVAHAEGGKEVIIYPAGGAAFHAKNRFGMPDSITYRKGSGYAEMSKYWLKPQSDAA